MDKTKQERTDQEHLPVSTGVSQDENIGYTNEERIAEDAEGRNLPDDTNEKPSGTGIASKEKLYSTASGNAAVPDRKRLRNSAAVFLSGFFL